MSVTGCSGRSVWVITLLTVTMAGCASLKTLGPPVEDISKKRRQRSEAAARRFDRQRDVAEFEAAQVRWREGDFHRCTEILRRVLARTPDHIEARLLLAESLLADNRPTEAIPYLEPALAIHASDARVHHLMGLLLDSIGQRADALVHYEQATRLRPDDEVYAVSYQMLASDEESKERSEKSVAPRPSTPVATPTKPTAGSSKRPVALGWSSAICFPEPLIFVEDSQSTPQPIVPIKRSTIPSDPNVSLEIPTSLLQPTILSQDSRSLLQRCVAVEDSQSPPRPVLTARDSDATHLDVSEPARSVRSAATKRLVPDVDRADSLRTIDCAEPDGHSDHAVVGSASELLDRGSAAVSTGGSALALACFRKAMAVKPDDPQIPTSAAICALEHNQPDMAVALLEPLLEVFADSVAIRRILGAAYYRLGDYQSSQVVLQQALSLDKSSGLSYFLMGCTLAKLGQLTAAETHFCQARRLDPRYAFRR